MDTLPTRLKNKISVFKKTEVENSLGESDFVFVKIKDVWSEIIPVNGRIINTGGEMQYSEITHKVTVRVGSISNISNDMYFEYLGAKLDILYFLPHYKYRNCIEINCKEEING